MKPNLQKEVRELGEQEFSLLIQGVWLISRCSTQSPAHSEALCLSCPLPCNLKPPCQPERRNDWKLWAGAKYQWRRKQWDKKDRDAVVEGGKRQKERNSRRDAVCWMGGMVTTHIKGKKKNLGSDRTQGRLTGQQNQTQFPSCCEQDDNSWIRSKEWIEHSQDCRCGLDH